MRVRLGRGPLSATWFPVPSAEAVEPSGQLRSGPSQEKIRWKVPEALQESLSPGELQPGLALWSP